MKVKISSRALMQRINRRLAKEGEVLRTSRGTSEIHNLGNYFIVDLRTNSVTAHQIDDLEGLAREIGVIKPYEELGE